MFQKTPVWYLGFVSVIGFALFFFATYLAYDQPSLGISLRVDEQGSVRLHKNGTGPASGLEKGWSLEQISGDAGQHPISEQTLIEDFMNYYFPEEGARFDGIMLYELHPLERKNK